MYLQLVISASYDLLEKRARKSIDLSFAEVRRPAPPPAKAELVKATVIKEARRHFFPRARSRPLAPRQQTAIPRLFLAGDWTATGWPSTMEGAVRSGYLAAEALLRSEGTPGKFLQPDLRQTVSSPCGWGSKHSGKMTEVNSGLN